MRIERVPLSALPVHFTPIAASFAVDDPRLRARFAASWRDERALVDHVRRAASRGMDPELKLDPGPAVTKLRAGAAAILTGQQPSVALGPIYNVYKAVTAVRWARRLESLGIPAVPVFWNHSDDDNVEGLNRVVTPEGAVEAAWSGEGALAFRKAKLDLDRLAALLPSADVLDILRANTRGEVAGDFTRLLRALFGDELLVVEPRQLDGPRAREIYRKALAEPGLVQSAVDQGGERLKELGFDRALGHSLGSNVYAYDGPRRVRAASATGRLSAGVALRLIVQDAVLPTALVVAGPNEVAYLAQLRELYAGFGRTGPVIAPRLTATLVDPRAARIAEALGVSGAEMLAGAETRRRRATQAKGSEILGSVDGIAADLDQRFAGIEAAAAGPLRDSTRKTREKMRTILAAYRERVVAARQAADGVGADRVRKLSAHLTPEGKLQERVLSVWYFLSIAGMGLVKSLTEELDPFSPDHQLAWL